MMWLISAYINKKDTFSDVPVSNDSRRYVQDEHQPNVSSDINISPSTENVNGKFSLSESEIKEKQLDKEDGTSVPVRCKDEKRIQSWLNVNRLQLPLHNLDMDSNNRISPSAEDVNGESSSNSTKASLSEDLAPVASNDIKYSLSNRLENAEKTLYNSNSPLSVVNRATTQNNSSINWVYKAKIFLSRKINNSTKR